MGDFIVTAQSPVTDIAFSLNYELNPDPNSDAQGLAIEIALQTTAGISRLYHQRGLSQFNTQLLDETRHLQSIDQSQRNAEAWLIA
jgi:hypothetical protein